MNWLPDTNIWISYFKNPEGAVERRLRSHQPDEVFTCSVIRAELMHGAGKFGNPERRRQKVLEALQPCTSLPFDDAAADEYAKITNELERRGEVIGPFDRQIAAIARVHGLIVATNNVREFSRIEGLSVEDWTV